MNLLHSTSSALCPSTWSPGTARAPPLRGRFRGFRHVCADGSHSDVDQRRRGSNRDRQRAARAAWYDG